MTSRILQEVWHDKGCQPLPFPVLEEIYPRPLVMQILTTLRAWEQRQRRLNHLELLYLLIAWTILPTQALHRVPGQLRSFLHWAEAASCRIAAFAARGGSRGS